MSSNIRDQQRYHSPNPKSPQRLPHQSTSQSGKKSGPRCRVQITFPKKEGFQALKNDKQYLRLLDQRSFVEKIFQDEREVYVAHLYFPGKIRTETVLAKYGEIDKDCTVCDDYATSWEKYTQNNELTNKIMDFNNKTKNNQQDKDNCEVEAEEEVERDMEDVSSEEIVTEYDCQIYEPKDRSLDQFLLTLSKEFANEDLPDLFRPKIGMLIQHALIDFKDNPEESWNNINVKTRDTIKQNIFAALAYINDPIKDVAAELIAIIYSIEYAQNGWKELTTLLTGSIIYSSDSKAKKSPILTLRKLCSHFKTTKLSMHKDIIKEILSAICVCMQTKEIAEVKSIAINALSDLLDFAKDFFQNQIVGLKVMDILLQVMISSDKKTNIDALRCLIKFIRISYTYLDNISDDIWKVTSCLISSTDKQVALLAIEVWNTITTGNKEGNNGNDKKATFQEKGLNITTEVEKALIPTLFQNLLCKSGYEDDNENIVSSIKNFLTSLAKITKDRFLEYGTGFVGSCLISQNNFELKAGLIVYTCMLDGPSHESLTALIPQAISTITLLLDNNQNMFIKEAAAIALQRTAEIIPSVFFQNPLFSNIFHGLIISIESHPRISLQITKLWHHLGEYIVEKQQQNQQFNLDLTPIIDLLMKNVFRDLEKIYFSLIDYSFLALVTLFLCIVKPEIKAKYVRTLVNQFKTATQVVGKKRDVIQAGLLACLQTLLQKFEFNQFDPIFEEIFNLILEMFNAKNAITSDGIYVLSALASAMGTAFKPFSRKAWSSVLRGFKLYDESELFLATLNAIVELARACPEETVANLHNIFKTFLFLLNRNDYDKSLKLRIIMAIGDISLGCKDLIFPYVEKLARMYDMAMNAAVRLVADESPEMVEYLEELRETTLESYLCFFHSLSEGANSQDILESLSSVMRFLAQTCTPQYNPTVDYMRNALTLVADITLMLKEKAHEYWDRDLAASLIEVLERCKNDQKNVNIVEYAKKVFKASFELNAKSRC